ncbi:MAG: UvrD-helicase domain-containing protein [Actinobacteria bacterium]|nr:UvrD-helicase domain-containing protein [Actinomycetota bacterium]
MNDFVLLDPSGVPFGQPAGEDPLVAGLNPQQRRAVEARGQALLIVAGAGSGKTRVLTHRIAQLIRNREAWPSQILAITFTNKAAAEMRERVEDLMGGEVAGGMWISTFHSACVRILRREAERFGYVSGFTIYDSADSRALLKRIIKEGEADSYGFTPANTSAKISRLKNELQDAASYRATANESDPRERIFVEIFHEYEQQLRRANAFDFDDLIGQTVHLFRAHPDVAAIYQRRFRHILVDEYQDTNHAQYSLIRELTRGVDAADAKRLVPPVRDREVDASGRIPGASLTVVGDSDQSIYAFRGADIRNIVEFERDFPGAEVVKLEQNYRSTQNILSAANAVIGNNFDRQEKNLFTTSGDGSKLIGFTGYSQHDEARFVAEEIEDLHRAGVAYGDIAVFYRTNSQTRALEELLIRGAIPYRVLGGTKFYERAEIKDAMSYLTSLANPYDPIAWSRLIGVPKRGIGPMAEAQLAFFQETHGISFHDAMLRADEVPFGPKVRDAIKSLGELLLRATRMALGGGPTDVTYDPTTGEVRDETVGDETRKKPAPVADVLKLILDETEMIEKLRAKRDPQDEARAENLEELVSVAREFDVRNPGAGLLEFLTEVSLVAAADDLDDQSGTVSLMTLHTAKGLEFNTVFLTGVEEGLIPHQMSVDEVGGISEERRLMYVGITRARERLYLTLASTRSTFGDINVAMPSRFLQEIPDELVEWRQSPGEVTGRGGTESRALNAPRGGGYGSGGSGGYGSRGGASRRPVDSNVSFGSGGGRLSGSAAVSEPASGGMQSALEQWRERKRLAKEAQKAGGGFPNMVGSSVRDNGDLELAPGDRIRHDDHGEGRVTAVTGVGSKRIAHAVFDSVGERKLLIKLAPIEKVE